MAEPDRPPEHSSPKSRKGGLLGLLQAFLVPGPWRWVLKQEPPPERFHPGHHMHGLEDHDLVEPESTPSPQRESRSGPPVDDRLLR